MGEGKGECERRRITQKKFGRGRRTVRERENKKIPCCFGIYQSLCLGLGKKGRKEKCPPHSTLKRIIYFL
jgi:hypothetical protein